MTLPDAVRPEEALRRPSTATAYCWLVWRKGTPAGTHFHWIAPCRKRLERDTDYPSSSVVEAV